MNRRPGLKIMHAIEMRRMTRLLARLLGAKCLGRTLSVAKKLTELLGTDAAVKAVPFKLSTLRSNYMYMILQALEQIIAVLMLIIHHLNNNKHFWTNVEVSVPKSPTFVFNKRMFEWNYTFWDPNSHPNKHNTIWTCLNPGFHVP